MADWTTSLTDLRTLLCDTDRDNLVKDQKLVGRQNGQNRRFFTFWDRLIASGYQDTEDRPIRVFVNDVEIAASGILVTDPYRGEIELMYVVSGNNHLEAAYYHQKHTDPELTVYLTHAAKQVNSATVEKIIDGLQYAALQIAASMAHQRLAERLQQRKSDQFMYQEVPTREAADDLIQFHRDQQKDLMVAGLESRKAYYDLRNDKGRMPAYKLLKRQPPNWTPRR